MMRYLIFIFAWLFAMPFAVRAQKAEKIERLKSELARTTSDTARIRVMLSLAMTYEGYQMDSAMAYTLRTLETSEKIHDTKGRADAKLHLGRLKRDQSKDVEALNHMFDALKLYREIDDKVQIANSLNDISIIYANSADYKNSLNYFKQALEIFQQTGDEKGESYALNNIGIIYQEMKDLASAKDYFIQSLNIKIKRKDLYGISRGYTNLGSLAENDKNWKEAMAYYEKADSIYMLTNDKQVQGPNYLAMARVKQNEGRMAEARKLAVRGFEISKEIDGLSVMLSCSKFIAELDENAKDYKSSLAYQKIYNQLADSLNTRNHKATLEELKGKFNLEEKEREITLLKKDKELHEAVAKNSTLIAYALAGSIVFLLMILGLIYYAYRTTKTARDSLAYKNKEIEQQKNDLDKINKEKDRFFSILSHDLRSPLNSLKGLSYLLVHHSDALSGDETKDVKKKIDTSLDNLTELINNILEWSMTTSKKKTWTFDKLDTSTLIQKNIALYHTIAESKGVRLVHAPGENVVGYADYQAIDTVVRNLLSNSIKFSHPNSDVTVKAVANENTVLISVQDQGIGIPSDLQDKLFTMNSSVTQAGTKNEKGTGIGLLLCKELMKENNGDISVKSRPGEGSEFFVSFPVFRDV
ncbi:tetratricopeptide repeat-containing sensor histidine kinase [Chryseolinea lacunae]|uniref:histidine kinase n=1 Tax=Chryseolinea lacunae TaxID=2801331 RepID=A0ABS1KZ11_9BACT|nr:tetratricopeptide repeat protein [Chryseolinea lacunae]MBL0744706.1 tetratricopeptide repeat-containing sensor histidine kinase [Chryseolinea lacunae]